MSASQNMQLLGGIFDFLGGMAQQAQARQQARNIEYMAGINKANFENNAALEVQRMERLAESSVATIESTYAASGVSVSEGSALRVAASEAAAAAGTSIRGIRIEPVHPPRSWTAQFEIGPDVTAGWMTPRVTGRNSHLQKYV